MRIIGFGRRSCLLPWKLIGLALVWVMSAGASAPFLEGRILIKPAPGRAPVELAAFHAAQRVRVLRRFDGLDGIQVLQLAPGRAVPEAVKAYQRSGLVAFAEPDYRVYPAASPNDPKFLDGTLWYYRNTGQSGGVADADIDAVEAWDAVRDASGVVVAVIDTGVRYTHQDLAANMWVNPGEIAGNMVDDDGNGYVDDVHGINGAAGTGNPWDLIGHGTQVAGMVGAVGNNGLGVCGAAWEVQIMACRYPDDAGAGSLASLLACIDYARTEGADIINASFVIAGFSSSLQLAVNKTRDAGIIFVAAAGNDAADIDASPVYPAAFTSDNIVAVTATTRSDVLAGFSSFGSSSVDLAAPGASVYTTSSGSDSAYILNSGTSFAAPMVAGAFALMKVRYPTDDYRALINRVYAAVDPLPSLAGKCVTGGRLNLFNAIGPSIIADFQADPVAGEAPLAVNFTDTTFGAVAEWRWDFGDGNSSGEQNPSHIFQSEGNYTVTLTVTSGTGLMNSKSREITVVANYQIGVGTYDWIDPSGMTALSLANNGVSGALAIPFQVEFYGQSYSELYVGANGLFGFSPQGLGASANTGLPNGAAPNNMICPFWDALKPAMGGTVYYGVAGSAPNRKAVVTWLDVRHGANPPANYSFQAWIEEGTQNIQFQYQAVTSPRNPGARGVSATIGLEHSSGLVAAAYSYNGSSLVGNGQAILFVPGSSGGMGVSPATGLAVSGNVGGPFSPLSRDYVITNTSSSLLDWSVASSQPWLDVSSTSGSLSPGESTAVTFSVNAVADTLPAGSYSDSIAFRNEGNGLGNATRLVTLAINGTAGRLAVTPDSGLSSAGVQGGPFVPGSQVYTLYNEGDATLDWSAQHTETWVTLSSASGTLGAGESTTVTAAINGNADALLAGSYADTIVFANETNGDGDTSRPVILIVTEAAAPPQMSVVVGQLSGLPEVTLHGVPGASYAIELTFDLLSWTPILTNQTAVDGTLTLVETNVTSGPRFFRGKRN